MTAVAGSHRRTYAPGLFFAPPAVASHATYAEISVAPFPSASTRTTPTTPRSRRRSVAAAAGVVRRCETHKATGDRQPTAG